MGKIFSSDIKSALAKAASAAGFDGFAICSVQDFSRAESEGYQTWLDNEMNAQMKFLDRAKEKKLSPKKFFEKAESAICLSANFFRPSSERRIALYAQSEDYHEVIARKLKPVIKILEELGGEQKLSIDASPLWEKALAARAGLGWIGKNTLLTRKENGAWSFLCVILTSLKLPFDAPQENLCKDCDACVRACPSKALSANGLDAKLCISNLTIEKKTPLTSDEQEIVGDKIFGCDICLRACPFGKNAPIAKMQEFQKTIKLSENPSQEEILKAAQGTPMSRKFKQNLQ